MNCENCISVPYAAEDVKAHEQEDRLVKGPEHGLYHLNRYSKGGILRCKNTLEVDSSLVQLQLACQIGMMLADEARDSAGRSQMQEHQIPIYSIIACWETSSRASVGIGRVFGLHHQPVFLLSEALLVLLTNNPVYRPSHWLPAT